MIVSTKIWAEVTHQPLKELYKYDIIELFYFNNGQIFAHIGYVFENIPLFKTY